MSRLAAVFVVVVSFACAAAAIFGGGPHLAGDPFARSLGSVQKL
jgi:hypothetical protein